MEVPASRDLQSFAKTSPQMASGLKLLMQAFDYAHEVGRDVWDFAVEIEGLQDAGLTNSDLRWLVCRDLVEHEREITMLREQDRVFRKTGKLTFTKRTCFVLAPAAAPLVRPVVEKNTTTNHADDNGRSPTTDPQAECLQQPKWDRNRQQFCVGDQLVKVFRLASPNQETILTAFEEEEWPPRIDDPLPPTHGLNSKRRLQDTIKSLNRHQVNRLIRFMGDGTGEGVRWQFIHENESAENGSV